MSFRTRLITFFVLIVVLPMLAIGLLVFKLIDDSQQGKADARVTGVATVASSLYGNSRATATADAELLARQVATLPRAMMAERASRIQTAAGLARVGIRIGGRVAFDHGDPTAIAPGIARVRMPGQPEVKVVVSELTAPELARDLAGPGVGVVVRQRGRVLGTTFNAGALPRLPAVGKPVPVSLGRRAYRGITTQLTGFGAAPVYVGVFSSLAYTDSSTGSIRLVVGLLIGAFFVLALAFAVLSSRSLQGQIRSFLHAARQLAAGDFSAPVEVEGHDEFAALGTEFNKMSRQLSQRLDELGQERRRLRESLRRIGELFASNLDREALLDLALQTSVSAVNGSSGRLTARAGEAEPLNETARVGDLGDYEALVLEAERGVLRAGPVHEVLRDGLAVIAVALCPSEAGGRLHGVITVARRGERFDADDRELLQSLAAQAAVALENIQLHVQISEQAVTDPLTGLANHGRFQERLSAEVEQVRRYGHPLSLILLDIDGFKAVNDTFGHQQGDLVLKDVARILRENSREADMAARYGGEEMALILPHTELEGAYAIAERVRSAIAELHVHRLDGGAEISITASLGVAALTEGSKDLLIGEADAALYRAKRTGKNRTVRAIAEPATVTNGG